MVIAGVNGPAAERQQLEGSSVKAGMQLPGENRPPAVQLDEHGNDDKSRSKDEKPGQCAGGVDSAFDCELNGKVGDANRIEVKPVRSLT